MPRATRRRRLLSYLERSIMELLPLCRQESASRRLRRLCLIHHAVDTTRYLDRPSRAQQTHVLPGIYHGTPTVCLDNTVRHYEAFRVTAEQLDYLTSLFNDYPGFYTGYKKPQAPPKYQIGALMYRMAHGHGVRQVARVFGVSAGAIMDWTDCALLAIMQHTDDYIYWPDAQERRVIAASLAAKSSIRDCVGLMDGMHVHTREAPSRQDAGAFYCRHGNYGLNILLITDHLRRIRYIHYGLPASTSDTQLQADLIPVSPLHHQEYLSQDEWILADSIFMAQDWVVPMYKRSRGQAALNLRQEHFNSIAAPVRVACEQAFGVLKARFRALHTLNYTLQRAPDEARAHSIVLTACVLHNILIDVENCVEMQPSDQDSERLPWQYRLALPRPFSGVPARQRCREYVVEEMLREQGLRWLGVPDEERQRVEDRERRRDQAVN